MPSIAAPTALLIKLVTFDMIVITPPATLPIVSNAFPKVLIKIGMTMFFKKATNC